LVSTGSPYLAHVSRVIGKPHIAFGDTEIATTIIRLMLPFTAAVCTPSCFALDLGPKQIRYNGYHELAYLHPNYFTPDPSVLDSLGLTKEEDFLILRLSSWDSSHDIGHRGMTFRTTQEMSDFMKRLEDKGKVFLTSELKLPVLLEKYRLQIPPEKIHDLLSYATMYIGEGATMASEAGVLGTPWIFTSTSRRGYLDDQEKNYGLGYTIADTHEAIERVFELLANPKIKDEWRRKRARLLQNKVDVTKFIVEFLENWPESFERSKRTSCYE